MEVDVLGAKARSSAENAESCRASNPTAEVSGVPGVPVKVANNQLASLPDPLRMRSSSCFESAAAARVEALCDAFSVFRRQGKQHRISFGVSLQC